MRDEAKCFAHRAFLRDDVHFLHHGTSPRDTKNPSNTMEARTGFEPAFDGFANRCLTTWLPRQTQQSRAALFINRTCNVKRWLHPCVVISSRRPSVIRNSPIPNEMLKLGPRKKIDPNKIPKRSQPQPAHCGFCQKKIPRPKPDCRFSSTLVGTCSHCGAWFIDDSTGKLGGEAWVVGLTLVAGPGGQAMQMREGIDFEQCMLAYDSRRHEVDPHRDAKRYGVGRMWYFRALDANHAPAV